ncbi:MAG: hypothetical protein ABI462_10785, partial [Ignavibacteria bacterium]
MKKIFQCIGIVFLLIIHSNESAYSANEYFRSIATGNWNSAATWQMSTNSGGTWIAATSTPNDTSGVITIQSPNTVTITVNVSADQLIVNNGATISINAAITLTIKDGSGTDLFVSNGGAITGSGTLQTQGTSVLIENSSSNLTAAFKVNSGTTTAYDASATTSVFKGTFTVDAGATFAIQPGGYPVQVNGNVVNNGIITSSGGYFVMRGPSLTNNDTIRGSNLYFDSTTSLSGTGAYTSSAIAIRSTGNVSLANNLTFSPTSSFTIISGGVLNPNTKTFTFNSGTCFINSGGTVFNSGIFQTQGIVAMVVRGGSNFNGPLKVNTGTTISSDDNGPFIANYKGSLTVDAGAILTTQGGGYSNRAYGNVTNNGTITGNSFIMRGPTLTNNSIISPATMIFDSTTSLSGTGLYNGTNISINSPGVVSLSNNLSFSPGSSFVINNGGTFTPSSKTFTFTSGNIEINSGGVVTGTGINAGIMQTQNNVNFIFRNGSTFNSAIRVNTGTLTAYNDQGPYFAVFSGTITVDAGATLTQPNGGYTTQANNIVTNNGTITSSGSGNNFRMRGSNFINNNSVTCYNLSFDSSTAIAGAGTYTGQNININTPGILSFLNNVTFALNGTFSVNGGILNPNSNTVTFNSCIFAVNSGGTTFNSGLIQTQGTATVYNRNGSIFNTPFKVNTGNTLAYNDQAPYVAAFNGPVSVDAGATLTGGPGGYTFQVKGNVINNGTMTGTSSHTYRIRGASLINNNLITGPGLTFDSVTTVSGAGSFTNTNITIGSTGNVSLGSNVTFSPGSNFSINGGGILNPNTFTFTLIGVFYLNNLATVSNSGIFRTQGSTALILRAGCIFNAPLKINTGSASVYDDNPPYIGAVNGPITIDTGATITSASGGYTLRSNGDVTNNGTISASAPAFRMYGTNFINNGNINFNNFFFETGAHNLSGTGTWQTNANVVTGSTVTLGSDHKMASVTISSGGTFNLMTFKLSFTASNPIVNSGTFNTTTGMVEYNGTSGQSISTTNITYNKLRINNNAGTSLINATAVNDSLQVVLGDLNLNGFVLTLSPTGYLTETPGNTVKGTSGYITTTRTLNAPSGLNVGGLGAVLTTAVNLGSTEIRRGHNVQSGLGGNTSILRYYDITPTTNTGLN